MRPPIVHRPTTRRGEAVGVVLRAPGRSGRVDEHAGDEHAVCGDVEKGDLAGELIRTRDGRFGLERLRDPRDLDLAPGGGRVARRALGDAGPGRVDTDEWRARAARC